MNAPDQWEGLDPGIRQIVIILAENGVETCQSCAASGPFGVGSKAPDEKHAYSEPTVEFRGQWSAGWHALRVAFDHGLPVYELRRVWSVQDGEPVGPHWAMTFDLSPRNLVGWIAPDAPAYVKQGHALETAP